MQQVSLNGTWELRYSPQHEKGPNSPEELARTAWPTVAATVPGNVELDLVTSGKLDENIEIGSRVYELRKYETYEWWYRRTFQTPSIEKGQRVELVFEGLDCVGTVWLNGERLGETDNMFIAHRFDVTDYLRADDENE